MPRITKLEVQKKRANRFSLFLDGEFALGIDVSLILKFNLAVGDEIDTELLESLIVAEETNKAKDAAIRLLAHRARSKKEVKDRLLQKGFNPEIIRNIIDEFEQYNYLDDRSFAGMFVRDKMRNQPMGERRLRQELYQKGIDQEIIDQTISDIFSSVSELDLANQLAEKQIRRYTHLEKEKAKRRLTDYLKRRGFNWDVIIKVLGNLN